ncbi:MAG: hypothetical protein JWM41_2854 [Gemmatimonadetes bacterium]|nr:hypothetical protein [Gemmatimonadota bacterium]
MNAARETKAAAGSNGLKFLAILVLAAPAYWSIGVVGSMLWRWYVTPAFASAPHLTAPMFVGLWISLRWFTGGGPTPKRPEQTTKEFVIELISNSIAWPWMALFFAWCVKAVWL